MMLPSSLSSASPGAQTVWPSAAPTLHSTNWLIRLVQNTDLPALMKINGDELVTRYLPYPTWRTMSDAHAWLARMQTRMNEGSAHQFVIAPKTGDGVVGTCMLFNHNATLGTAEVGFVLGRAYWRQGVMREVLPALITAAFGEPYRLRAVEARTDPQNTASNHLLECCSFKRCATRHDADHGTTWVWRLPAGAHKPAQ